MIEENRLNRIEDRQADGIGRISAIEKLAIAAEERAREDRKAAEERAKEDRQAAAAAQQEARQAAADARKEAATDRRHMMIIYSALVVTVWGALAGAFFLGAKGLSSPAGSSPVQQVEVPARQAPARDVMDGASDEIGDARPESLGLEHGSFLRGSEKTGRGRSGTALESPAFSLRPWMQ